MLVVEQTGKKTWYLVEANSKSPDQKLRLSLISPPRDSILAMGFSAVHSINSDHYDPTSPLWDYRFFDQVKMTGTVIKSDMFSSGFALEMNEVVLVREHHHCYVGNRLIQLHEIEMPQAETVIVKKNIDELFLRSNPVVRLDGILVGNYLLNLFYITDFDSARSLKQIRDEKVQSQSIMIDDFRFIERVKNLISAGVGGELMYLDGIHVVGELKKSNNSQFPAIITNVREAAIQRGVTIFHLIRQID